MLAVTEVVIGDEAQALLELSATVEADVIAASTHLRCGLDRWPLDRLADTVLPRPKVRALV